MFYGTILATEYIQLSLFIQAASRLFLGADGVYKQSNCIRLAVMSNLLLSQHDVTITVSIKNFGHQNARSSYFVAQSLAYHARNFPDLAKMNY